MRSPTAPFDLRAALSEEIKSAQREIEASPAEAKAVHACRVHLKRARALARVGRGAAPGLTRVFNESARTIMRTLAQARDLAALSAAARRLAKKSRPKSATALNAAAERLDAGRRFQQAIDMDIVRAGLRDLLALAQVWPETSARQIEKGANRVARRARQARRRSCGVDIAARRHKWRKREKDRLYAATLLGKSWPQERKRRIKKGEALSEALGRERDALLLIERIEANPALAGEGAAPKRALSALKRRRAKLGKRADTLGADLHAGHA